MRLVITGGTGFLGSALVGRLRHDRHEVTVLTRNPRAPGELQWNPAVPRGSWTTAIDGADAVIHLAGAPIAEGRWTERRKAAIHDSRIESTRTIVAAIASARRPPGVLVSGSAVGFYGDRGDEPVTEEAAPGSDFLARVAVEWEGEALAVPPATRLVLLRTGVALDRSGGALPKMALPFYFFAGGPLGSGRQYVSWIHRDDWVEMVCWALVTGRVTGPLNATAPNPVTNREFATTLGRVLRRPALIPTPAAALRLALGEMGDALLLSGQQARPAKALARGFTFRYPTLAAALREIFPA